MRRQSRRVSVAKRTELLTAVSVGDFRCVASARVIESELKMVDRQSLGDLGFAILLGLTLLALARPQPIHRERMASPPAVQLASADRAPAHDRIGLFG